MNTGKLRVIYAGVAVALVLSLVACEPTTQTKIEASDKEDVTKNLETTTKAQDLKEIQQKKELFKVYTQLLDKNVELAKERQNNVQLTAIVNSLNKKSDKKTDKFTSSDPENTSTDARNTAKLLKQTESANRDLAKSNSKIKSLEAEVRKIVMKMEKFDYVIEIKNK